MKTKKELFAKRLNELMKAEKLSNIEVERQTGIPDSTVSSWRTGKYEPTLTNLWVLADFFKLPMDYLIGRSE